MTKAQIIKSFNILGVSLPSNGESDYLTLPMINHIMFSEKEGIFPKYKDLEIKIDTKNEIIKVFHLKNGNTMHDQSGRELADIYDFNAVMMIATTKVAEEDWWQRLKLHQFLGI